MKKQFDREFFVKAGQKGGKKTLEKHGVEHFKKIRKEKKDVKSTRSYKKK
jgi:hypothetical protein